MITKSSFLVVCCTLIWLPACLGDVPHMALKPPGKKSASLPACKVCTILVDSFRRGIDKTARGKHDGGDAAWEEDRLRSYKTSEVRLVEIQESLCNDAPFGEDQCHQLAEEHETDIEKWWFNHQSTDPDFFDWFCVRQLKVCCAANHFGPHCAPCVDCHGNGRCKGNGTRKGNGKCVCDTGYEGDDCMQCASDYYESFKDDTKLLCSPCHQACGDGGCTTAGPKGCRVCRDGWLMSENGCADIDECLRTEDVCKGNKFCVNTEGSYSCLDCDRSCDGCTGDGPDLCDKCADGYELRDGLCTETLSTSANVGNVEDSSGKLASTVTATQTPTPTVSVTANDEL